MVGRSSGGNAVRTAAYNERTILVDERIGRNFNFRDKDYAAAVHHEVLLPVGAGGGLSSSWRLWNAVEQAEKRKDSQLAKEVVLALPTELGLKDWQVMARKFAQEKFVSKGLAVQIDIHADAQNPHAHLLVTTRRVEGDQLAANKARDLNPAFRAGRDGRKWIPEAERMGELWAAHQDRYFREHGHNLRVDPAGNIPQIRVGLKRRPGAPARIQANEIIQRQNREAALDPERVIAALTRTKATFSEREVSTFLRKAGLEKPRVDEMRSRVLGHASLVALWDTQSGERAERWTTHAIRAQERQVMAEAGAVAAVHHPTIDRAAPEWMKADQRQAFDHTLSQGGLKLIVGHAGTGKTAVLKASREAHERAGYRAVGMGPTNTVASDMRVKEGFKEARTAHSWLFRLNNDMARWDHRTVVFVDEAAMQSTAIAEQVLRHAKEAGAKVVMAGDDRQLGSIERGGMFTELVAAHGSAELTEVIRQKEEWQRQASRDLAAGRYGAAVEALDAAGAITWRENLDGATAALVGAWAQDRLADPGHTRFAFAWTNEDVDTLNAEMRAVRVGRGELRGPDHQLRTAHGTAAFAVGDRIAFTDTAKPDGIFNGETGTITHIRDRDVRAKMDSGKTVRWDPQEMNGFRHGYAGTIYRGQGATLDAAYVLHTGHWRAAASYVGLTRQRETIRLFVAESVAANQRELAEQVGRPEQRSASLRWSDNREEAVDKSVDYANKLRAEEQQRLQEWAKRPAESDLEFWGREVTSGALDYADAWTRIWTAEVAAKNGGRYDPDELAVAVDNKLQWAIDRGERWQQANEANRQAAQERLEQMDAKFRSTATPAQWAAQIARGNADIPEAIRALRGSKTDDETTYRTMRVLMDALKAHEQRQTHRRRA